MGGTVNSCRLFTKVGEEKTLNCSFSESGESKVGSRTGIEWTSPSKT